jgi:hypothetical protein
MEKKLRLDFVLKSGRLGSDNEIKLLIFTFDKEYTKKSE